MEASRKANVLLRMSYIVFLGFLLMAPVALASYGISGGEGSSLPFFLVIAFTAFALVWQIATVFYNRQLVVCWFMLIVYLVLVVFPIIESLS
jgi:hypothetical protein